MFIFNAYFVLTYILISHNQLYNRHTVEERDCNKAPVQDKDIC